MTDLFGDRVYSLDELIGEAERELGMRLGVYPRRVAAKAMSQKTADHQIALQRALVTYLRARKGVEAADGKA